MRSHTAIKVGVLGGFTVEETLSQHGVVETRKHEVEDVEVALERALQGTM